MEKGLHPSLWQRHVLLKVPHLCSERLPVAAHSGFAMASGTARGGAALQNMAKLC